MSELRDIKQGNRFDGTEIMFVADETNCVQFINVTRIEDEEPFELRCDDHWEPHTWRRVWVKT